MHSRYLARTAYLEVNASHAIRALSKEPDSPVPFRHQGIIYYPDLTIRRMSEILHLHYKYYILDFGTLTPHTFPEFLRCDHRVVLTNVSVWKSAQLDKFARQIEKNKIPWDRFQIIYMGGIKEDYERIYKSYGFHGIPMPFLDNPFHITSGHFRFFEKIMT